MKQMKIKMLAGSVAIAVAMALAPAAFAQSNGNFSATATAATCSIGAGGVLGGGTGTNIFSSEISTSSGSGVTLKITPSLVTGLFTDTKITTSLPSASADVGIQVCVKVDGSEAGILPKSCVIYDERFQQISSQLFSQIAACNTVVCTTTADCGAAGAGATCINPTGLTGGGVCVVPTATACTTTADCTAGQTCINPTGGAGAGLCNQVAGVANNLCNFDLILSTLSAHSFDFVIPVSHGKTHTVTAEWSVVGAGASNANASVASCVGPGILTVTQMKVFNNSGALLTF